MYYCRVLFLSVLCAGSLLTQVRAADVAVTVGDNFFTPRTVTINVNDRVVWTWTGISSHTSTGPGSPPLWDSGYQTSGTFSRVFDTVGRFYYYCIPHVDYPSFMSGLVTVQGGNTPPTLTITNPVANAVFVAPATFTVAASASDSDGSVSQVEFFRDTTSLGVDTVSPYRAEVTNLAAGTYAVSAVATDNLGAKATNSITVSVVNPVDVVLSGVQRLSGTNFQFRYTANPGLRLRSRALAKPHQLVKPRHQHGQRRFGVVHG